MDFHSSGVSGGVTDGAASRKIYGAYRFGRAWSLEMGTDLPYSNMRDVSLMDPSNLSSSYRPKAWELAGTGTWSISRKLGLVGRLGAYSGDVDLTPGQLEAADRRARATYGLGLKYDFTSNFRVQGGWDHYRLGQPSASGEDNVDLLSIGLKYKF